MSTNNSTITVKLLPPTIEALKQKCKQTNTTMGDVIDRMVMCCCIKDPESASLVLAENFLIVIDGQTEEEIKETFINFVACILSAYVAKNQDQEIVEKILQRTQEHFETLQTKKIK